MNATGITRRGFLKTTLVAAAGAPFIARGATTEGFEIGLVADAQYADVVDNGKRFYRKSLARLGEAVEHFNGREIDFSVHLGDLIDREWRSFEEIKRPLALSRSRWHHLLGNHDFEVLSELRPKVPGQLGLERRYGFFDHRGFRFVLLDTNDVSTYAHPDGSAEQAAAEKELKRLEAAKVLGAKKWNGAVGSAQLTWLAKTCADVVGKRLKVIVFAHHPIAPDGIDTLWNAPELLTFVERERAIVAWLNGHHHAGGFAEQGGVPLVTLHGMVETPELNAFATAKVFPDRLVLTGHGRVPSRELVFRV